MKNLLYIISLLFLFGCAGSATHDVVSAYQSKDRTLTCSEIDKEIVRAQVIIDGVNEDKSGISGADIMDGLLYFPFIMIAKSQNVKDNENWPFDSPAVCRTIPKSSPKEPSFKVSCSSRSASLASLSSYSFVSLTLLSSSAFSFAFI